MGEKSPAKVLRSTKRITNFLRNKWKTEVTYDRPISKLPLETFHATSISIPPKPTLNLTIQHIQTTSIPPYSLPLPCSCSQEKTLSLMNFDKILKQNEKEGESEREKLKLERKREREKDFEKFQLETQLELEKLKFDFSLPPRT